MRPRKLVLLLAPAAGAALIASQWRDIIRYAKIKQLSTGNGHPANVPAPGRAAYPKPGSGAADGTGHFSGGRRGGAGI